MAGRNPRIPEPESPGWWVDCFECECGARYGQFRGPYRGPSHLRWEAAARGCERSLVEAAGPSGMVFMSRGPVLWWMRVSKLEAWYQFHRWCEPR